MAADSPRRGSKYNCHVVKPEPFSDKGYMGTVVDFISDVVPQAYSGNTKSEDKDKILWARFENCDANDLGSNPNICSKYRDLPMVLILGYCNGVQVWLFTPTGDAQEVLSLRQGPVRALRILPTPAPDGDRNQDEFREQRPLVAVCDASSCAEASECAGQPYCSVKFLSLRNGDEVRSMASQNVPVQSIHCNRRYIVVTYPEKIDVVDAWTLRHMFWIQGCFPCPGLNANPVALGTSWLAYADRRLVSVHQSCGGMSGDGSQSYAATVIGAAKGAMKGMAQFGNALISSVTGVKAPTPKRTETLTPLDNGYRPGIVSILDLSRIKTDHFQVTDDYDGDALVAHFHAHANEPVAAMSFDRTGYLLLTACKLGHNFHVFCICAHPCSSCLGAVHHLYTLHRGDTMAKVVDIAFSDDSRWVSVSTHRGTTHLFPITPYGGQINVRTHCQPRVVNRLSRFQKTAGIEEMDHSAGQGRNSPVLSGSPNSPGLHENLYPTLIRQNIANNNLGNPRLPPYPHPTTVHPLHQFRQTFMPTIASSISVPQPSPSKTAAPDGVQCVAAFFCEPRLAHHATIATQERRTGPEIWMRVPQTLYIVGQTGVVTEYSLDLRPKTGVEQIGEDSPIEVVVQGISQWQLQRSRTSAEVPMPAPYNHPLVVAADAVIKQRCTLFQPRQVGEGQEKTYYAGKEKSEHGAGEQMDQWLSQVEINTYHGPHRRLWMGPQFTFKMYSTSQNTVLSSSSSALLSQSPETQVSTSDIMANECDLESLNIHPARSSPVAMPAARPAYRRSSGSDHVSSPGRGSLGPHYSIEAGSFDQSPSLSDVQCQYNEYSLSRNPPSMEEEERLRETLADAMVESPVKDLSGPTSLDDDVFRGSTEALSSSSGSSGGPLPRQRSAELLMECGFPGGSRDSSDLLG